MMRQVCATFLLSLLLPLGLRGEQEAAPEREWPDVLVIDNFESGLDKWGNQDAGALELVDDAPEGRKALRWTAADDGIGHIIYKNLKKEEIDFSQYDLLVFQVKFEGKRIWNLNPVIRQYPAAYGYRALYYSIDTMEEFGEWFTYSQDLRRWENAWPHTFSTEKQEFQFEVSQLAGPEKTKVYLDDIRLLKNSLGVAKSYPGRHARLPDGTQVTHFRIRLQNRGKLSITVRARLVEGSLRHLRAHLPADPTILLPGEAGEVAVRVVATPEVIEKQPVYYGETARVTFTVDETPGLVLFTELTAGTKPEKPAHPSILLDPARMTALRRKWKDPEQRKQLDRAFHHFVRKGEQTLGLVPEYPPLACPGRTKCSSDGTGLTEIQVPNLPFKSYQCPKCGTSYSGPVYDAGMQKWAGRHLGNASAARNLGFAYAITGRREFAVVAARVLKDYIDRYLALPISAPEAGSPVYSHTSGACRIGGSYMYEKRWLGNLAIALDFIRPASVLSEQELNGLSEKVFTPSAHLIMDHKVGAMNLQWMIESSALYAGLACESPGIIARAMYDKHGIVNLIRVGYLPDGNWWENPSYQNVANGIAFPVLATCINTGLLPWNPKLNSVFKAAYKLYGPDGRSPTLGTGGPGGYNYSDNAIHSLASHIEDPELAWAAHHRKMWRATSGGGEPYQSYLWALTWKSKPKVPQEQTRSPIPDATTDFPHYGGIALRVPGAKSYCYLHYGRELVHGHRNKLSINAYADGAWFVRNVMGGYGDNFMNFLETIGSSTSIMVDGKNPDADTGELLFHRSGNGWEAASAREVGAYKDVEHERSVVLTRHALVVIDRVLAGQRHTYDWLYHSCRTGLSLDLPESLTAAPDRLGESPIYESLRPIGAFGAPVPAKLSRKDGSGLKIGFVKGGELFAFKALGKYDGLLWRQKGKTVSFACAMSAHGRGGAVNAAIQPVPVTDSAGTPASLHQGQAYRATAGGEELTVLVNYTGKELKCGEVRSKDRVTVTVNNQ